MRQLTEKAQRRIRRKAKLNADGRITADVACIACRYNLHMLRLDDRCPECGRDVVHSFMTIVDTADHRWLRRVSFGASLLAFGMATRLAAFCVLYFGMDSREFTPYAIALAGVLVVVPNIGAWLFAEDDPSLPFGLRHDALGSMLRAAVVFELIIFGLIVPISMMTPEFARVVLAVWQLHHVIAVGLTAWIGWHRFRRVSEHGMKYTLAIGAAFWVFAHVCVLAVLLWGRSHQDLGCWLAISAVLGGFVGGITLFTAFVALFVEYAPQHRG